MGRAESDQWPTSEPSRMVRRELNSTASFDRGLQRSDVFTVQDEVGDRAVPREHWLVKYTFHLGESMGSRISSDSTNMGVLGRDGMTRLQATIGYGFRRAHRALVWAVVLAGGVAALPASAEDATIRYRQEPAGRGTAADKCVVCHSVEANGPFRYAPNLYGIVGAEKAREREWYGYSPALMKMGGVWTEEDLDAYLADADKFAPGTTKTIKIQDPEERKEIIEFLKSSNS